MPVAATEAARLKAEIDLPGYIRSRGIALVRRGSSLVGLCPFHEDTHPSLSVTPERGLFHCFACGMGGDVIRFVERLDGVSFPEAVRILAGYTGYTDVTDSSLPQSQAQPQFPSPLRATMHRPPGITAMNAEKPEDREQRSIPLDPGAQKELRNVLTCYKKTLERMPEALAYLQSRGLVHPELISEFRLGYADGTLFDLIPASPSREGRYLRDQFTACGILRHKNGRYHEHMQGRIVVPFIDEDGVIHQIYGRRIARGGSSPDHLYLPFAKNCVFHPRAFISQTLIVCEGPLDALSFFCAGMPNVTCTTSAGDIPAAFLDAIDKGNVRRVLIAFDADEAGDRGAEKLAKVLNERGIETARVKFPAAHAGHLEGS
jgi:DNA primase